MPSEPDTQIVSKLNSILLAVVISLLAWTVKGVTDLKEKGSANEVLMANAAVSLQRWALETQVLRAQVNKQEIDIAIIKVKMGLKLE